MSADPKPEIIELRLSRREIETLKHLAVGLGDLARVLGANLETKTAILTLLTIISRAEGA